MLKINKPITYKILIAVSTIIIVWSLHNIIFNGTPKEIEAQRIYDTTFTYKQGPDSNHDGKRDTIEGTQTITPRVPTRTIEYLSLVGGLIAGISGLLGIWLNHKTPPLPSPPLILIDEHVIFSKIDRWIATDLRNLKIGGPVRTQMFKIMIGIQLSSYRNKITDFLNTDLTTLTVSNIRKICIQLLLNIATDYEKRWLQEGVPQLVIDRYNEVHLEKINEIMELAANDYTEPKMYIHAFLSNITLTLTGFMHLELLLILASMNGEVQKLTFRGESIV